MTELGTCECAWGSHRNEHYFMDRSYGTEACIGWAPVDPKDAAVQPHDDEGPLRKEIIRLLEELDIERAARIDYGHRWADLKCEVDDLTEQRDKLRVGWTGAFVTQEDHAAALQKIEEQHMEILDRQRKLQDAKDEVRWTEARLETATSLLRYITTHNEYQRYRFPELDEFLAEVDG